ANRNAAAYCRAGPATGCRGLRRQPARLPGPLAGFMAGLAHCRTPWLLCVPCDTPLLPLDLAARMLASRGDADIVIAHGWDTEHAKPGQPPQLRAQPVFCLLRAQLASSLECFIIGGGRKIDAWTGQHRSAQALFDRPGDEQAFSNANTLAQLLDLEQIATERQP
ncbi:NTP transferase domain-containing protein, partial [Comamonas testosteroni]|uniref:NTP transferase domain-containing protein n=1 Tax=Comamonas testosteroni TaxID=285 RepID=UPI00048CDB86